MTLGHTDWLVQTMDDHVTDIRVGRFSRWVAKGCHLTDSERRETADYGFLHLQMIQDLALYYTEQNAEKLVLHFTVTRQLCNCFQIYLTKFKLIVIL